MLLQERCARVCGNIIHIHVRVKIILRLFCKHVYAKGINQAAMYRPCVQSLISTLFRVSVFLGILCKRRKGVPRCYSHVHAYIFILTITCVRKRKHTMHVACNDTYIHFFGSNVMYVFWRDVIIPRKGVDANYTHTDKFPTGNFPKT